MPKTSYWKQKNRADAAEAELGVLKLRCQALVNTWTFIAKRAPYGSPVASLNDQHSRELREALLKATQAVPPGNAAQGAA